MGFSGACLPTEAAVKKSIIAFTLLIAGISFTGAQQKDTAYVVDAAAGDDLARYYRTLPIDEKIAAVRRPYSPV